IMQLTSSSFQQGAEIPEYYTSDGEDASPELSWRDAPSGTKSFALIVHDPDAPRPGGFTHWTVYNIPPETGHIEENVPDTERVTGLGTQGKNDGGKIGYMGRRLLPEPTATSSVCMPWTQCLTWVCGLPPKKLTTPSKAIYSPR